MFVHGLGVQDHPRVNGEDSSLPSGPDSDWSWRSLTWNQDSGFTDCVEKVIDYPAGDFLVRSRFENHGTYNIKNAWRCLCVLGGHFLLPCLSFAVQPNYFGLWTPSLWLAGEANALTHRTIQENWRLITFSYRTANKQAPTNRRRDILSPNSTWWEGLPQIYL